jgi:hypothetical protein
MGKKDKLSEDQINDSKNDIYQVIKPCQNNHSYPDIDKIAFHFGEFSLTVSNICHHQEAIPNQQNHR